MQTDEESRSELVANPLSLLSRALDQTGAIIARVTPGQAGLPSPCSDWNVRELINHTVQDMQHFTTMAVGGEWEQREEDVIGDDWLDAYREAADDLLGVWQREGALDATIHSPIGELPATWRLGQQITDLAVHGWDIAKATGQSTDLDLEIGRMALDWGQENLRPQFRGEEGSGKAFGLEVPVAEDAPVHDRLAGLFGRDPAWPDVS